MSTDTAKLDALVRRLEEVRQRPWFWLGRVEPELATVFLFGITECMGVMIGSDLTREIRWQVVAERGWKGGSRGPSFHMRAAGLSEEAIVDELFAIEIEVWRRVTAGSQPGPG